MSYSDIIKRLEDATGPDRGLDAIIWLETTEGATRVKTPVKSSTDAWPPYVIDETRDPAGRLITVQTYTASIDAAIALVERTLKTYSLSMGIDPSGNGASLVIWPNGFSGYTELGPYEGCATSLPVAILLALFRALEAKEQAA